MKRLLLPVVILISSSCASLTVGHENFRCEGTDKGGICAPTYYVYQHRKELMQEQLNGNSNSMNGSSSAPGEIKKLYYEYLNVKDYSIQRPSYIPQKPVRLEEEIQRIYIFPYKTKDGNLIEGHYIYTVVKPARWLYFVDQPPQPIPKHQITPRQTTGSKNAETREDKIIRSYIHEKAHGSK